MKISSSYIQVTTTQGPTAETTTTIIDVQWGSWGDWSEWAPTCYDDSANSIYKDSDKYYPKRSRTRDCIRTENGVNTTVAVNDASGKCPYEDKLEKEKDENHATGRFQKVSFSIFYNIKFLYNMFKSA